MNNRIRPTPTLAPLRGWIWTDSEQWRRHRNKKIKEQMKKSAKRMVWLAFLFAGWVIGYAHCYFSG